ncbi:UNVERIFIED_CONTAM: IclR family KDG regulon transcriptional repressor [Brevibacillus sp. OAP136]
MSGDASVKSVDRALQILHLLSLRREGYGVTELSKKIPLNKTSVYRMLSTMVQHGLVKQDPETERYKLGYKILQLSSSFLESIDIRKEAEMYLKELEEMTNEVIHLVVYDQGVVVYIETLEGNQTLRMHSKVGRRAPMHCTSVGKVILANLPMEEAMQIIEKHGLNQHTPTTITSKDALFQHLQKVKQQGYALDLEENEPGIRCIAAPIFDPMGRVTASFSISGPTIRMSDQRLTELKDIVIETGQKISARVGYKRIGM